MNRLYYGDCLTVMQELPDQSVDLIYLDPPFNSNRSYNAIYKTETGQPLPDQIEAFCDMWELDAERERAIRHMPVLMREAGIDDDVAEFWRTWLNALRGTQPRLLAYLSYMVQRLLPMRRLLKPTGSIYYHCDPTAAHYIKVMLDGIFGHARFRNEIVWSYNRFSRRGKAFPSMHDSILFYTRGRSYTFNVQKTAPRDARRYELGWHTVVDRGSRRLLVYDRAKVEAAGIDLSKYDEVRETQARAPIMGSVWTDIPIINPNANERMGYETQKPLALLERIIRASSNEGDMVLDPFCGCATTMEAAHGLGRDWIGIDIAIHAIKRVARVRLAERLGLEEGVDFTIEGVPRNVEGARDLWERDKYQFQKWAVEQADGFVTSKRTADGGIDGRLYFYAPDYANLAPGDTPLSETLESMVIEVKGGRNVSIADVRALRGVLDNDDAAMAGLIVLDEPGARKVRNFAKFMGEAGTVEIMGNEYPRMQILTVPQLLDGRGFYTPTVAGQQTRLQPAMPGMPQSSP